MSAIQPFYIGDIVTVIDRGDERFVITKLPTYSGGSYTLTGAYDDTLEIYIKPEGMTLYKASPYRPAYTKLQTKRAEREQVDTLLDAWSSYRALEESLPDGPMCELLKTLREEAENSIKNQQFIYI